MRGGGASGRPGGSRFRADVEGLRAVAVLLVMLYHAGLPAPAAGFLGVDVFFVVSGFVITGQLLRELESTGRVRLLVFYGRRAKRLLPASATVIGVTAVAAWALAPTAQWRTIATDLVASSLYVVNWVFAERSVDYLAEDVDPSPVQHYWSLAVEEQFYLVWPLVILLLVGIAHRRRPGAVPSRRMVGTGLSVLVVVPSLVWALHLTEVDQARAFFVTHTRLWELGVGALVALGVARWQQWRPVTGAVLAWAGLLTVVSSAVLMDGSTPWPAPGALAPVLGTAAVIVGGFTAGQLGPVVLLGTRPLVWIGGLSYALYLWHWALLSIATWQVGEVGVGLGVAVVTLSVVPAWLSYRWVETPLRHSARLTASAPLAIGLGVVLSLVSALAGLLLAYAAVSASTGGNAGGTVVNRSSGIEETTPPGDEVVDAPPVYDELTPHPLRAVDDRPDLYDQGCQVETAVAEPVRCDFGDPDGDVFVAVVGDSKVAQWVPVIDDIARREGWRVVSYTKSGCSASTATVWGDEGEPYPECTAWSEAVLDQLRADPPQVYLTSGRRELAGESFETRTSEAMTQGYVDYWTRVNDLGATVVAVSDTPGPRVDPSPSAYQCVSDHPDDYREECSWPYERALSSQVLQDAVDQVDGATYLDMDPWVCPAGTCHSVLRNIVTYRQGSHITQTYAFYLGDTFSAALVPLVDRGR